MPPQARLSYNYDDADDLALRHFSSLESIEVEGNGKIVVESATGAVSNNAKNLIDENGQPIVMTPTTDNYQESGIGAMQGNPLQLSKNELRSADDELRESPQESFYDTLTESLTMLCIGDCGVNSSCYPAVSSSVSFKAPLKSALKKVGAGPRLESDCRNVSFNQLEIREYNMILGDHPSAQSGPPVQLSWDHDHYQTIDLESYERGREPRRTRRNLKLSFEQRKDMLVDSGFTLRDIEKAWSTAMQIRQQRYETVMQGLVSTKLEEVWQSANRKLKRMFFLQV